MARDFDGVNDNITPDGTDVILDSTQAWSIYYRARYDGTYSAGPDQFPVLFQFKTDQATGIIMFYSSSGSYYCTFGSSANFVQLRTSTDHSGTVQSDHDAAIVFDGVSRTASSSYKYYLNGTSESLTNSGSISTVTNDSVIGSDEGAFFHNGPIQDIAVWEGYELTQADIDYLGNGGNPFIIAPDSIHRNWPFEGNQSPEAEISGNSDTATLSGTTKTVNVSKEFLENHL